MKIEEAAVTKFTNVFAVVGVSTPMWWPSLEDVSGWATQMVPICSVIWLVVQIVRAVVNSRDRGRLRESK
jgi:hypothetical protein